jgi:hypothetical protein
MTGRVSWSRVTMAVAVIAAVAIAAPALGGQSATTAVTVSKSKLKKLIAKEVAKQIPKATGPPGPAGANGVNGLDGTARAYARVISHTGSPCTGGASGQECDFDRSKGVASVTRQGMGSYCVTAPGISSASVAAAVTIDSSTTDSPPGNAGAMADAVTGCPGGGFEVRTTRQPVTSVRNAADNGSIDVAGNAIPSDGVGFTIVIP